MVSTPRHLAPPFSCSKVDSAKCWGALIQAETCFWLFQSIRGEWVVGLLPSKLSKINLSAVVVVHLITGKRNMLTINSHQRDIVIPLHNKLHI